MPLLSKQFQLALGFVCLLAFMIPALAAESAKVIILGSGTPIPDPSSSGPCVAIVVNGQAYLFDAGPGVVRQAQAAAEKFGIEALDATHLTRLFITHLHSDHTLGYPDLILTPWVVGRREPLEVYGPKGIAAMTDHLKQAYAADIQVRTNGMEGLNDAGLAVNVHEIDGTGVVYKDPNVTVRSIVVKHGSWPQAFGFAIDAGGRRIVISGDTMPTESVVKACNGCDILVHEVYSEDRFNLVFGTARGQYHRGFHTSTRQLAELASRAKPKLLVLYHQLYFGAPEEVDLVKEIHQTYSGLVVNGRDLTEY
ncbi:MAG TPA: MBL fold metallo-hydrolase [Terracidiphilus sp.]|nr:MBL fold metallo-hydrolase [Terracidiphilus sp.]